MPTAVVQREMKRDGRTVSRAALEEMRLTALERMKEGESPAEVAASFGLHRGWWCSAAQSRRACLLASATAALLCPTRLDRASAQARVRSSGTHRMRVTGPLQGFGQANRAARVPARIRRWRSLEVPVPTIRKAHANDAKALSEMAEATFRATFGAMNTAEHMDHHCRVSYGEQIQAAEIIDPGMVTLVIEDEGRLIGYAQLRRGRAPDCVSAKRPVEIQRLYVVGEWHGKGMAQELMNACIEQIGQYEADALWLGVWEHNPRAISFYRKAGFVEAGDHIFPLGGDPQRDIVMVRSVAPG